MVSTQQNFIISSARGALLSNQHSPLTFLCPERIERGDDLLLVWGRAATSVTHHAIQKGGHRR